MTTMRFPRKHRGDKSKGLPGKMRLTRRGFGLGLPMILSACAPHRGYVAAPAPAPMEMSPIASLPYDDIYAARAGEPHLVPAVDWQEIAPQFLRQEVAYTLGDPPGTVSVDLAARFAYFVTGGGRAIRYGVGIAREADSNFQGEGVIARKAAWPNWRPTPDMIAREPERYGPVRGGLPGGSNNPLGPRALYIYRGGQDTLYRLHGTTEPWTIGTMTSSGCVRLLNQDIIDLYGRVSVGARLIVRQSGMLGA